MLNNSYSISKKIRFFIFLASLGAISQECYATTYISREIEPHEILGVKFVPLEEGHLKPVFTYKEVLEDKAALNPPQKYPILYELDESDVVRSAVVETGKVSLGKDKIYAWIGFHRPIKHEHAPLEILVHDGVSFGTNCIITGGTVVVIKPYCDSLIQSVSFKAINSKLPMELKGILSLVKSSQRSGEIEHIHGLLPLISGGALLEDAPCNIFESNFSCTNVCVSIQMK